MQFLLSLGLDPADAIQKTKNLIEMNFTEGRTQILRILTCFLHGVCLTDWNRIKADLVKKRANQKVQRQETFSATS